MRRPEPHLGRRLCLAAWLTAIVGAACVSTAKPGGTDGPPPVDAGAIDVVFQPPPGGPPFLRDFAGRAAPPFVGDGGAPPADPGAAVSVTVDTSQVIRTLPRTLYGNNVAVWNGDTLLSGTAVQRLGTAGVSIVRFPGGSTSDGYFWNGQYPPYAQAQGWDSWGQSWALDTAEYMQLVHRLGAIPLITANYGYASYDTTATDGNVANAAQLAADWVEYCNAPNDGSNPNGGTDWAAQRATDGAPEPFAVPYWEIGNEVFGSWETGYDPVGGTYARNFNAIADAMKAVDPTIAIGLVVDPTNATWTRTVLSNPGTAARADFLIAHTYFAQFSSAAAVTAASLLPQASQVAALKTTLDGLVTANTTRTPDNLPYYLGEYNVPGPTNALQISLASGLFIAKVLGEIAGSGWAAASLWDVLNGYDAPGTYGAGDQGFLSSGQPGVPDLTPRPTYYDFYFFSRNFGDRLVAATSTDPKVSVWASTFTGGGVGLVVVNEDTTSRSLTVSIAGASPSRNANVWILSGPTLEGPAVTLNGVSNGVAAGGPAPEAVPAYTLTVPSAAPVSLDVPAASVTSIVVY